MKTALKIVAGYLVIHGAVDVAQRACFGWKHGSELRGASWQEIDNAYHSSMIK